MKKERISIVYCTPSLYIPGGVERVLTTKMNYLADILGYEVTVVLTDGDGRQPAYPLSPRIRVINLHIDFEELWKCSFIRKIPVYLKKQRIFRRRMEETLMTIRPDITVSTLRREINFLTSLRDGSKKVGELHVCRSHYRNFEAGNTNPLKELFAKMWMHNLVGKLRRLDRFVTLTEEDKACWPELPQVTVIPNPTSVKAEGMADPSVHKVIAVGRFVYQKGFDLLIEAWGRLCQEFPDWELHIYGPGDKSAFQAQGERVGASNLFLEAPTDRILEKYRESGLFVLSSRFEGFGMVIVEAMTCGLPVVSFACPCGPRDIVRDSVTGLLAHDGNVDDLVRKMAALMSDETLRTDMGRRGAEEARRYDVPTVMAQWDRLFHELTESHNNPKKKGL